VIYLLFN